MGQFTEEDMSGKTEAEMKAILKASAERPIPADPRAGTNWGVVHHRIMKGKQGVPNCDCPMCLKDKQRLQSLGLA